MPSEPDQFYGHLWQANLLNLRAQSFLPNVIDEYIEEAVGDVDFKSEFKQAPVAQYVEEVIDNDWGCWFDFLINESDVESC